VRKAAAGDRGESGDETAGLFIADDAPHGLARVASGPHDIGLTDTGAVSHDDLSGQLSASRLKRGLGTAERLRRSLKVCGHGSIMRPSG